MDYNRKMEYFLYLAYKKMDETKSIEDKNPSKQKNVSTKLPEMIETFISGRITKEELEILKAKKKRERREKRRKRAS